MLLLTMLMVILLLSAIDMEGHRRLLLEKAKLPRIIDSRKR
jgi:hypothetical protein